MIIRAYHLKNHDKLDAYSYAQLSAKKTLKSNGYIEFMDISGRKDYKF
jgi:hypothetical protein